MFRFRSGESLFVATLLRTALALLLLAAAPLAAAPQPARPLLSAERIKADVAVLADDSFEGRGPAQAGEAPTLAFLTARFRALGLRPAGGDGSYLQTVRLWRWQRTAATLSLTLNGRAYPLHPGLDVAAAARADGTTVLDGAQIVFVGYGVVDTALGYDPYAGIDVRGRVVVALAGDPDVQAGRDLGFGGRAQTLAARGKAAEAERRGAAGFLQIHEDFPASYPWSQIGNGDVLDTFALDEGGTMPTAGVRGWLRNDVGVILLRAGGIDYAAIKREAQRADFRGRMLAGATLTARLETRAARVVSHNVVGVLPGTTRAGETVLYGAHWDANGTNAADPALDRIRNGAIDNATGTATVLEIARAFAAVPRTRRSVVFALWTAEEKGLLGATWYAEHPLRPLATTAAAFNLDPHVVLGRTRDLELIGGGRTPLEDDLRRVARAQGLRVELEENTEAGWYFRSDHFSFAAKGVPTVYFRAGRDLVDGGIAAGEAKRAGYNTTCYHQTCDTFDAEWDLTGAAQEGSVADALGREIADGARWPEWAPGSASAAERARSSAARR